MRPLTIDALIALQGFVVAFIALHDWIPLGVFNDVRAVQAADPRGKLVLVTVLSTAPFAFGLGATIVYAGGHFPGWLTRYLWISYGATIYACGAPGGAPISWAARARRLGKVATRRCSDAPTPSCRRATASGPTPSTSPCI